MSRVIFPVYIYLYLGKLKGMKLFTFGSYCFYNLVEFLSVIM